MSRPDPHPRDTGAGPPSRRSRRGADLFGDVLPEHTRDEAPEGWGEHDLDDDERLRREVPPHHQ